MQMGAYADKADRLIERGFAAIPIIPGTKKPGVLVNGQWFGLTNWQKRFNRGVPAEGIRANWAKGDAGVGVITGKPSKGTVAIDIDTDDAAVMAAISAVLPPTPIRKRGAKGETLFYYGPAIGASRKWIVDGKTVVELIGPGRQTVLPPTMHPDTGTPYQWTGSKTLEEIKPDELPVLDADAVDKITAALKPFGYEPEAASNGDSAPDCDSPHRQLNDMALADLGAWVPALGLYRCRPARGGYEAVPIWRPSTTGRPAEKRHLNLKIVPAGIRDFGADQGYTPLDLVMAALGCDLDAAWRFLADRLGFNDGPGIDLSAAEDLGTTEGLDAAEDLGAAAIAGPEAPASSQPAIETTTPVETSSVETTPSGKTPSSSDGVAEQAPTAVLAALPPRGATDPLEPYTRCPGVVGDIVDFIVATARRPNRVLALGPAITVVGTLIGRRVAGPTRSATHLYVIPIGPTGAGKQHLLDSATALMASAKASGHIGPSEFISMPAVLNFIARKPLSLCLQDEFGAFLKRILHKRASGWEAAVSKVLRSLWGTSFAPMTTPEWANREMKVIQSPAISILGLSTPDEFHGALQGESVDNGFLNRFLVLNSDLRAADRDPEATPGKVPAKLRSALRELYLWSGPRSLLQIDDPEVAFAPDVMPWASDQARNYYREFEHARDERMDDEPETKPYIARAGEMAVRLATIRAAGRWGPPGASVDLSDIEWGAGIAWVAGIAMADAAMDYFPETERGVQADLILNLIRRRGTVKVRKIQQHIKAKISSRDIRDILKQYVEAGLIELTKDGYRVIKPENEG